MLSGRTTLNLKFKRIGWKQRVLVGLERFLFFKIKSNYVCLLYYVVYVRWKLTWNTSCQIVMPCSNSYIYSIALLTVNPNQYQAKARIQREELSIADYSTLKTKVGNYWNRICQCHTTCIRSVCEGNFGRSGNPSQIAIIWPDPDVAGSGLTSWKNGRIRLDLSYPTESCRIF